ncbi:DNA-processing protein DprA [Winogradskya humida]|nr:DNA-processing protein DprA [Actinoplanes humidus]
MPAELDQRVALVTLLRQPGVKWADVTAELLDNGSAVEVLNRQFGIGDTLFHDKAALDRALTEAAALVDGWVSGGIGVHSLFDVSYPTRLRDVHQAPPLLFSQGTLAPDRRAVAVVGTRKPTERGAQMAGWIAGALAGDGITVVSGLAAGIDTAAHTAALTAGGRTVAVIGTGITRYYPAENRALQRRIAAEGLVISQFWPDAAPTKFSFPMRNAVMSGYSAATVVVEAEYRSGARMQARLALEHGRPVVLPDELLVHDWARDYATRPGVHVVRDPDELVTVVNEIVRQIPDSLGEFVS